jgi:mannose-6-phosphate isomerase
MTDLPALYPFRTEPVYRYYIWGGTRLSELLGKPVGPEGTLAESWEIGDDVRVAEGAWQGRTLREVDEATNGAVGGDVPHYPRAWLPLLLKLSGSAQDLSVQIHPNDEQALRDDPGRGYPGKTEMYLILDAEPGAGVYWGLQAGVSHERLRAACERGQGVPDLLNFVPVKPGDVLYSPPGVVHALGKGIVFCEVQENSDITYRLYDWGRVDATGKSRELHLERGLAVLDLQNQRSKPIQPLLLPGSPLSVTRRMRCACHYFAVEELVFAGRGAASQSVPGPEVDLQRSRRTMRAIVVLEGEVEVAGGGHETRAGKAQGVLVPAALQRATVRAAAPARVLLAYQPDLAADVLEPLRAAGYTAEQIAQLGDTV